MGGGEGRIWGGEGERARGRENGRGEGRIGMRKDREKGDLRAGRVLWGGAEVRESTGRNDGKRSLDSWQRGKRGLGCDFPVKHTNTEEEGERGDQHATSEILGLENPPLETYLSLRFTNSSRELSNGPEWS